VLSVADYWERRYAGGGDSGDGSRGRKARIKARRVNKVIATHEVRSVIDWGCGDGQVLAHLDLGSGITYTGVDVSPTVLERLSRRHPDAAFFLDDAAGVTADLALSLDVLFHFPDDDAYHAYLTRVFRSATHLVLIHSTNRDQPSNGHVRHRLVVDDIAARLPHWVLAGRWPGVNTCDFLLYRRNP
jgi:trans-aconitate methyltransferase